MAGTPGKSSINILQEFTISKYRVNPNYVIKDVSPSIHVPRFEVTIDVDKISCSAQSTNKKQAKEMCARLIIEQLGITIQTSPKSQVDGAVATEDTNYNAIGYLNEYASKNSIPYPKYTDVGSNEKGLMIVECTLGQFDSHGFGPNKKNAKQNAASNLLKRLKDFKTPKKIEFPTPEKVQRIDSHQVNSTTASNVIIRNIKTEEVTIKEEKNEIAEENSEKPEEKQTLEKAEEIPETIETDKITETEKTEELLEKDMLEDFRLKLLNLGLKDDNKLEVFKNTNSRVLKYNNHDININVVKISYDLKSGLDSIYNSIKERAQS